MTPSALSRYRQLSCHLAPTGLQAGRQIAAATDLSIGTTLAQHANVEWLSVYPGELQMLRKFGWIGAQPAAHAPRLTRGDRDTYPRGAGWRDQLPFGELFLAAHRRSSRCRSARDGRQMGKPFSSLSIQVSLPPKRSVPVCNATVGDVSPNGVRRHTSVWEAFGHQGACR